MGESNEGFFARLDARMPVVPREWFECGSRGDALHQVACWAVLDPDDAATVEDYRPPAQETRG